MTTPTQPPVSPRQVSEGERTAQELRETARKLLLMAEHFEAVYGVKYDPSVVVPLPFKAGDSRRNRKKLDQ